MIWIVTLLYGASFLGLTYVLLSALYSGADEYSGAYSEDTARQFEDVFLFIPPKRLAELGWVIAAIVFLSIFFLAGGLRSMNGTIVGGILATIMGGISLRFPRLLLAILRARRLRKFNLQLVDTLVSMSNALKAGFSISQTFESVARDGENPIAQEFNVFLQQTRVGVNFTDALEHLQERVGSDDLKLVCLAIDTARQTGGNLTEIFEQISGTIRERMRIENRIRTLTSQGKLQGIVVGSMPIVIGVALMIVDPGLMLPFLHSLTGVIVIAAVVVLITLGGLIIRKIIRIDV
jgi:tight adherence protein B